MKIYKKYLKLQLTEKEKECNFSDETELMKLLKNANKELDRVYNGKFKFSITDANDDFDPFAKVKLSPKKKRRIKELWLKFDSDLSRIQRYYEKYFQNSLQNNSDEL